MPSKEEVQEMARKFLEVVRQHVQEKGNLRVVQTGTWWSPAKPGDKKFVVQSPGPTSLSQSGGHNREVFNFFGISTLYQTQLRDNDFPEQSELHDALAAAGIEPSWIAFGFLLPLVHAWCRLPEPLDLSHSKSQELFDTFAEAVIGHASSTTYRDVLVYVDLNGDPVFFEKGIVLRPVTEDELYEFSQEKILTEPYAIQFSPSDNWSILEIQIDHTTEAAPRISRTIYDLREAVIAALALADTGSFTLLPVGSETNFGMNALGRSLSGSQLPRDFGPAFARVPTALSPETRQYLPENWPRIKEVLMAETHYLALPLRRLVDGLGRHRMDDQIIDYAIGLEALLSERKERTETRYRFSLRGAVITTEADGDRNPAFREFRALYDARSDLVHGRSVSLADLRANSENGERLLREVWEWHLAQGLSLSGAIRRLDREILATS